MNTKVTIEENTTKIVLTPQNDFEQDVIEKCKDNKYRIIATADYSSHPYNASKHKIELLLSENAGTVDLYPELRKKYYSQLDLIKSSLDKLSKIRSTKAIEEIKSDLYQLIASPAIHNF